MSTLKKQVFLSKEYINIMRTEFGEMVPRGNFEYLDPLKVRVCN